MATSYWDYIRVEDLLALQGGIERDEGKLSDHEVLFITVHQVYELWFKLVLRELVTLRNLFDKHPVPETALSDAAERIERCTRILRVAAAHFEVVESLSTRDYLTFRDKLFPASGFQSAQMRELEILLGLPDAERIGLGSIAGYKQALESLDGSPSPARARVEARQADTPTLKQALEDWLYRTPIRASQPDDEGDGAIVDAFLRDYLEHYERALRRLQGHVRAAIGEDEGGAFERQMANDLEAVRGFCTGTSAREKRIRAALLFIEGYQHLPLLGMPRKVLQNLVELEQALVVFRQRHARMVERVIGRRTGTGGSAGVDYLDKTATTYRVFKDLWAVRTILLAKGDMPKLQDTRAYEFRSM